jgi:hypothetical protein
MRSSREGALRHLLLGILVQKWPAYFEEGPPSAVAQSFIVRRLIHWCAQEVKVITCWQTPTNPLRVGWNERVPLKKLQCTIASRSFVQRSSLDPLVSAGS